MGGVGGAFFGMNLNNHMENEPHPWKIVVFTLVTLMFVGGFCVYKYFRYNGTFPKLLDSYYRQN
jgi:hypothetical protein